MNSVAKRRALVEFFGESEVKTWLRNWISDEREGGRGFIMRYRDDREGMPMLCAVDAMWEEFGESLDP